VNPDQLSDLEEERRFLLRSLDDLDREHAAGDVDDADYQTLRDGYIARTATVLRAIQQGRTQLSARSARRPGRVAAWVVGTLVVAVLSGWLVARFSGQRAPGQTITGGIPGDAVSTKLAEARVLLGTDPAAAATKYTEVLDIDADNAEALTYSGWLIAIQGFQQGVPELIGIGATTLRKAIESDPTYADPHCLLAVALGRFTEPPALDEAREQAQACLDNNPPADMVGLVGEFLAALDAATTTTATTTTAG
jgi:hypothetical protein